MEILTLLLLAATVGAPLLALFLLPSVVAVIRRAPDVGAVVAVNAIFGATVIGWGVALAMALRDRRRVALS